MGELKPEHVFRFDVSEIASCEADIKFFAERHHPDTRKWFLNDFHRWFENPGGSKAYVLLGDAGVGKSVMAGVLAQKSRTTGNLASAYFCRHNDGTRNNPRYLLGTIACQLCKCNARYSNFVGGEGGIRSCLGNSEMGIQELFTKLLQEPLGKCNDFCQRKLIVIDALDETKYESREDFLDLIMNRFPLLPPWLVFFITSRPEDTVQVRLKEYNPCIKICAGNSENLKFYQQHELDIRLYLEKSVDFSCLPFSAEDVATKCNGLFLFAYYIERVLKDQLYSGKISQLTDLFPEDIGEFFRHNFTRIFRKVGADLYKKLFGCAIAAPSPLPVSFISYILQKENSDLDEQEVIDAFSTFLVVRTSDQTFAFLHSLIPSWLTDKKKALARLSVDRNKGGRYFRDIISEVLSDAIANQQGECPSSMERDVLEYCDQIGVRLLCDYGDSDSLKVVFRYLANYQVIARRLKTKGIEIYSIIGDVKLAICCDEISDREKEILREICIFLENNVDVLLRSPQLLHCCLEESSKTVKENLVFPGSRGATKVDHRLLSFCGLEILSEFDCFSLSPNKKLMARARKGFLSLFDTSTFEEVQGPTTLTGIVDDIHHLKFSPDGKFIFFGRLDKWFSLEEGCVKEFSQFNAQKQICYKWSYFLNGSRYIAVQAGHPPTGAHSRTCLINIFCLWAIYELERKFCLRKGSVLFSGWRETCNFQFLYRFELLHNVLQFLEPKLHNLTEVVIETVMKSKECHKSRLCQNCLKFEEQNEEENLNIVRQRVLDLYQEMFEVQVWDVTRGISFLEKAFLENGVQLTPMFFLYHLSAAVKRESRFLYEENEKLSCHSIAQAILVGSQVPTADRKWFADEVDKETPFSLYSKRKLEVLNRYFLLDHHLLDNGAVELGNHIVEEWISSSSDRKWSISRYKFGEFDIFKKEDKKLIKKFASKNVEHCVFLEDSNALLYYTRAQSLQIKYLESDIVLTSVTGHSPFFHPSTKQIVYWFVEQHGETINFLRDAPKDLIQFLLLLTTEGVFNGTFISAATVFSLSPKFCETVGKEDVVPFVPVKSVVFSQSGGLIACHLGPKLYICNIFDDAFSHLLCEDQCECDSCHLTFSPDSTLLLHYIQNSNDILRFQVWNVHSRALIVTFDLPAVESLISPLDCCCLSSDNTKLIVCGGFIIEIWEYGASACRLIAGIEHHVFISNYNEFTYCTVSSETNLLACCITDRIALCPVNTPTDQSVLLLPPAHLGKIELCQFVKGGRYLISYGVDGNVFLWDLNRCEAIAFAKLCQGRESIKRLCGSCEGDKFFFLTSSGRFGVLTLCGLGHSILLKLPTLKVQSEEMMLEESCGQQRELHGPKVLTHATDDLNVVEFLEEMNLMCDSEGNSESSDDCDDMEMLG